MSLSTPGNTTSDVKVTNISNLGLRLQCRTKEMAISYEQFPWFVNQPVKAILNVEEVSPSHFFWPDIDIDLTEEIIDHPECFPLLAP
jgi:hypothetical protein